MEIFLEDWEVNSPIIVLFVGKEKGPELWIYMDP